MSLGGLRISYHHYLFSSLLNSLTFPFPSRLICPYQFHPFPYVSRISLSISPPSFSPSPTLVMSTISKRKDKRSDIEAYYRNESKTFWFGLLTIGTKAKHIDLVQKKFFFASRSFPFWPKNSGTQQSNLIWSRNCLRQSRKFLFNPKTNRSKQKVLIWSAYYRHESKTF